MTEIFYTKMALPDSMSVDAIYLDEELNTLYVEFVNGAVASYYALTKTFGEFSLAESAGRFYNLHVKGVLQSGPTVPFAPEFVQRPVPVVTVHGDKFSITHPESVGKKYSVDYVLEGTTEFDSPASDITTVITDFVALLVKNDSFSVRVKGIKEIA